MSVRKLLDKNLKRNDIAEIARRANKKYTTVYKQLRGPIRIDPDVLDIAIAYFKEKKEKEQEQLNRLKSIVE